MLVVNCAEREHTLLPGLNYRDLKPTSKCAARTTGKTSNKDCHSASINQAEITFMPNNTSKRAKGPRATWANPGPVTVKAWLWIEVPKWLDSFMSP